MLVYPPCKKNRCSFEGSQNRNWLNIYLSKSRLRGYEYSAQVWFSLIKTYCLLIILWVMVNLTYARDIFISPIDSDVMALQQCGLTLCRFKSSKSKWKDQMSLSTTFGVFLNDRSSVSIFATYLVKLKSIYSLDNVSFHICISFGFLFWVWVLFALIITLKRCFHSVNVFEAFWEKNCSSTAHNRTFLRYCMLKSRSETILLIEVRFNRLLHIWMLSALKRQIIEVCFDLWNTKDGLE